MKLLERLQLLWMYLTEYRYGVVKVTPQNVYRIRKYYKRLPNITKKYVEYSDRLGYSEYTEIDMAVNRINMLKELFKIKHQKLLDKINEKETPV